MEFHADRIRLKFEPNELSIRVVSNNGESGTDEALERMKKLEQFLNENGFVFQAHQRKSGDGKTHVTDVVRLSLQKRIRSLF